MVIVYTKLPPLYDFLRRVNFPASGERDLKNIVRIQFLNTSHAYNKIANELGE